MANEPKKRHSRARQGKRRAHIHLSVQKPVMCENCGKATLAHKICANCGYYKKAQFIA